MSRCNQAAYFNHRQKGVRSLPFNTAGFLLPLLIPGRILVSREKTSMGCRGYPFGALIFGRRRGYLRINFHRFKTLRTRSRFWMATIRFIQIVTMKTLKAFSDSVTFNGNADNLTVTIGNAKMNYSTHPQKGVLNRSGRFTRNLTGIQFRDCIWRAKKNIRQRYISIDRPVSAGK